MKKFTIVFASLLTVLFVAMLCFVGFSKDFVDPVKEDKSSVAVPAEDNPIWQKTPEDLAQYLFEKGYAKNAEVEEYVNCNVCTRWVNVGGVMDVLWWDLSGIDEASNIYKCYQTVLKEQVVDGGSAFQLPVFSVHGPFAVSDFSGYSGDPDELIAVFEAWYADQ
ncbi:MAG: hypothetical protein J5789_02935 [Oscillospiraceae bacterium]|nr:hypothetical protein [Oscillospiraceae bacterium]MBR4393134.1 hypothetical protein [Oscillospiraceae bacterium]